MKLFILCKFNWYYWLKCIFISYDNEYKITFLVYHKQTWVLYLKKKNKKFYILGLIVILHSTYI